jgi:hypothetical protein
MPDIPLPEDLSTYIRSMESRIRALETAPRLQNSSVVDGVTTVNDATGVVRTQFGLLSDGTYGLAVRNPAGFLVNVNQTLFPQIVSYVPTQNISFTSYGLLPSGPTLTVTIGESGRAFVSVYADVGLNAVQGAVVGFRVNGLNYPTGFLSTSGTLIAASVGKTLLVTGLPAGSNTFSVVGFVTTSNANFSNTNLIVQPF